MRIISRQSVLAMWQAQFVKEKLLSFYPEMEITITGMKTEGDKILDIPLTKVGGKGLFVKELEYALLKGDADIAVHSLKDMPAQLPEGLEIAAILEREDARDALVALEPYQLNNLPKNAVVGTSSLRRQTQILVIRRDLILQDLRGNVDTRIQKLKNGSYQAMILAIAGLKRLGLEAYIQEYLPIEDMLPAVAQGALGIECRTEDDVLKQCLQKLHHVPTAQCVLAERSMNALLDGGCQLPTAAYASLDVCTQALVLQGKVASMDGKTVLMASASGKSEDYYHIGQQVGNALLQQGAKEILKNISTTLHLQAKSE